MLEIFNTYPMLETVLQTTGVFAVALIFCQDKYRIFQLEKQVQELTE